MVARRTRPAVEGTASPSQTAKAARERWILLLPTVPASPAYLRVKVWRRLQAIGAVALKNSVYVLPAREECVEAFQWMAREIAELGGQASLCEGQFFDGFTDDDIERRFIEARNADYAALADDARALAKVLRPKRLAPEKLDAADAQYERLKRRLSEIAAVDFCHAPGRESVEGLVSALGRDLAARRETGPTKPAALARMKHPRGATWVTRTGVHIDRIACAWLIRRFIDPEATFKFVPAKGYVPAPGELRFDMFEAEFTHVGDRCSFEVLLDRIGLDDPALRPLGEMVHDIDLRDAKHDREETAGFRSAITGLCALHRDDLDRIEAATPLLDGLHAFFSLRHRANRGGTDS